MGLEKDPLTREQFNRFQESIDRWRVTIQSQQDVHRKFLFGNGEPGMDEIMRRVLKFIENEEKKQTEAWSDTKKFLIGTLAFVVNTLLAIVIARMVGG